MPASFSQPSSGLRYALAALALGLIAVWGSENLFWTAPVDGVRLTDWLMTWAAYSLVSAAALSAVIWAGLTGWRAAFLGGAVLGFGVEGVIAGTMYDAFPFQLVWTPLAWHALITGLGVLTLPRVLARGKVGWQVAGLVSLGLFGAIWGLFWPAERDNMPGIGMTLGYLPAMAISVVIAHVTLDRLGHVQRPAPWVMLLAPILLAVLWGARFVYAPAPVLFTCPLLIGVTVWIMRKLGQHRRGLGLGVDFGPEVAVSRQMLFLLAPLITALLVVPGWGMFGSVPSNMPVAILSGGIASVLWLGLLWQAIRLPSARD